MARRIYIELFGRGRLCRRECVRCFGFAYTNTSIAEMAYLRETVFNFSFHDENTLDVNYDFRTQ